MRGEGWLQVRLGDAAAVRRYTILDGYILRVFEKEADCELEEAALAILDLRYVDAVKPVDVMKPPPLGPCVLEPKKAKHAHPMTLSPSDVAGGHDYDSWWLVHLASAVPDHALSNAMRSSRDVDSVMALMVEHAHQLSAHNLSDKEWRKKAHKEALKTHGKGGAKSNRSDGSQSSRRSEDAQSKTPGSAKSSGAAAGAIARHTSAETIAERLARAQERREVPPPPTAATRCRHPLPPPAAAARCRRPLPSPAAATRCRRPLPPPASSQWPLLPCWASHAVTLLDAH